jgi:hypothetical protein
MVAEMIEDYDWESEDSEDWESDEALAESEDSAEDIGERARRRRRQRRYYRPGRGVRGITVQGQGGAARNLRFPARLATVAETNRGLANQEVARRALAGRLERLEARNRAQLKKDSSVSGLVTLMIAGGLTAFGAIKAAGNPDGSLLGGWAAQESTKTAAVVSAAQLATSGAKLVISGRYHRSGIGITADIFAAAQLAAFAFGSFHEPEITVASDDFVNAQKIISTLRVGTRIVTKDNGFAYRVVAAGNDRLLMLVSGGQVNIQVD